MSKQIKCDQCGIICPPERVAAIIGWMEVKYLGPDVRTNTDTDPMVLHFCRPEHVTVYFLNKYGTQT